MLTPLKGVRPEYVAPKHILQHSTNLPPEHSLTGQ